jgi:hypothetical protein
MAARRKKVSGIEKLPPGITLDDLDDKTRREFIRARDRTKKVGQRRRALHRGESYLYSKLGAEATARLKALVKAGHTKRQVIERLLLGEGASTP